MDEKEMEEKERMIKELGEYCLKVKAIVVKTLDDQCLICHLVGYPEIE